MKKKVPNTIYTLILTVITVVSWAFFSIYRAFKKPLPIVVPPEITEPLNPDFNLEVTEKLKERKYFEEGTFKESEIKKASPSAQTEEEQNQANSQGAKESNGESNLGE